MEIKSGFKEEACLSDHHEGTFDAIVVQNNFDLYNSRFSAFPKTNHCECWKLALSHKRLPGVLRNEPGLNGREIFYFTFRDILDLNQGFQLDLWEGVDESRPCFLYVKYYAHIDSDIEFRDFDPLVYLGPVPHPNPHNGTNLFHKKLPITNNLRWKSVLEEIDLTKVNPKRKVEFGVKDFVAGDIFAVSEFALFVGEGIPRLREIPEWLEGLEGRKSKSQALVDSSQVFYDDVDAEGGDGSRDSSQGFLRSLWAAFVYSLALICGSSFCCVSHICGKKNSRSVTFPYGYETLE